MRAYVWLTLYGLTGMFLLGCVGGGTSQTSTLNFGTGEADRKTEQLFSGFETNGNNLRAGFVIDTDSPVITSYSGQTALRNFLAKQPPLSEFIQLADQTDYVSGAWIKGGESAAPLLDNDMDSLASGKYFLWGYSTENLPVNKAFGYDMQANWRCTGCQNAVGSGTGRLVLDIANSQAQFSLDSPDFKLSTSLIFTQKNQLQYKLGSDAEITIDGRQLAIQELAIRGGIFGPDGQNAGLLFGVKDERAHLTGLAIGHQP